MGNFVRRFPISRLSLLLVVVWIASACNIVEMYTVTNVPATESGMLPGSITPTKKAKATLTPSPGSASTSSPPPAHLALIGPVFSYKGINFKVDPVLGSQVFVQDGPDWFGGINFSLAPEGFCREVGCVTVYPVRQYRALPWGASLIDKLQEAIETQSYDYFPTVGAAILLRARTQHIRFENGSGIRAIVMRGQDGYYANNEAIVYDFHGLTDDGRYYVVVEFPIDAPILLSSYDPEENTNPKAIPAPGIRRDDPQWAPTMIEYNREAARQLEELNDSSFTPALGLLDALVDSLHITPESGE